MNYLQIGKLDIGTQRAPKQSAYYLDHFPRHKKLYDFEVFPRGFRLRLFNRVIVVSFGFDCESCRDRGDGCPECCASHEWDPSEGGMCINCGREDYYNFVNEDAGQER